MHFSELDYKKYAEIYENNKIMDVEFDGYFILAHSALKSKKEFLNSIHTNPNHNPILTDNAINEIDKYTTQLLLLFFTINSTNSMFSYVNKNFINEYVKNESEIEGVNDLSIHGQEEMDGLEAMYRYINSGENEYSTGSIILTDLHEKLYSHADGGRYARSYRNSPAYLPCSGVELEYPDMIVHSMRKADRQFDELYELSEKMFNSEIEDRFHMVNPFLEKLMAYKAELIRIHPFPDGNGRSIRGLINFLLERAGLPPVYVKACEKSKYHEAMNKAIVDKDNRYLIGFYKNKLCDSIEELVINPFEQAINMYKDNEKHKNDKKPDGNNVKRLFLYNDNISKSKSKDENEEK